MKLLILFFSVFNMSYGLKPPEPKKKVESTLNQFHEAASKADGKTYFGLFAKEGIFIGTDAKERWTVKEFKSYAAPYFSKGKGWTYIPKERHVYISNDKKTAWFDEILENKNFGKTRGSGVLILEKGKWKISQYHLTIPVPNELASNLVEMIRKGKTDNNTSLKK